MGGPQWRGNSVSLSGNSAALLMGDQSDWTLLEP